MSECKTCPRCGFPGKDSRSQKGGMVKGKSKARTSEQARAAVMVRWGKTRPTT